MDMDPEGEILIFIDMDGVLNTPFSHESINERMLKFLARLEKISRAKMVLSSTWRMGPGSREAVRKAFRRVGIPIPISNTPLLPGVSYKHTRFREIAGWLRYNTTNIFQNGEKGVPDEKEFIMTEESFTRSHFYLPSRIKVSHYVVLDDINLRSTYYSGKYNGLITEKHFVKVTARTGLTKNNIREAAEILGVPKKELILMRCDHCLQKHHASYSHAKELNKFFCSLECSDIYQSVEVPLLELK